MRVAAGAASDTGRVRDHNEDSFLVDDRLSLFAVADGVGGHRGGEVASATALEALRAAAASGAPIDRAVRTANAAVLERAVDDPDLTGMGTTVTAVVVLGGDQILLGHVGDSRAYLVRDGSIEQLTDDHSLVEEMVREGRLTKEQAEVHPQRSVITRALGLEPDLVVDLYPLTVREGDRVVLCSDGLSGMVRDRDIATIARTEPDPRLAADKLVDAANEAGGEDNITVLVLDVLEIDPDEEPDPAMLAALAASSAGDRDATAVTSSGSSVPERPPDLEEPPAARPSARVRARGAAWAITRVVLPLVLVFGVAVGSLAWYARRGYFVSADQGTVVVFKGVPGGMLGWDPTVEERTGLIVDDLTAADQRRVSAERTFDSREDAARFVAGLESAIEFRVDLDDGEVVIVRERAGEEPAVERRTGLMFDDLRPFVQDQILTEQSFASLEEAASFVRTVEDVEVAPTTTTTTTPAGATTTTDAEPAGT